MATKRLSITAAVLLTAVTAGVVHATGQPPIKGNNLSDLTLAAALELAERRNPALAAAHQRVDAAEAMVVQAGLWANPELDLEVENFGGSGELSGFSFAETTMLISQPLRIGGKIKHGRRVAESDFVIVGRERESLELDLRARTTAAFYTVLVAQERVALGNELLDLARSFAETVDARVEAGKVSPVESTRARMEVATVRVALIRAGRELEVARVGLSSMWGEPTPRFRRVIGELPEISSPPDLAGLQSALAGTPDMQILGDRLLRSERAVDFERSFRIPDLTVAAGPRWFKESGHSAWVAGISLPLPVFDRNQGARRAAEFELESTRREIEGARVEIEAGLRNVLERYETAVEVATALGESVVPAAEAALSAVEIGYAEGKFGFLDVIDAQRTLFDARSILLDSVAEAAVARVDLERMIGRGLDELSSTAEAGEEGVKP